MKRFIRLLIPLVCSTVLTVPAALAAEKLSDRLRQIIDTQGIAGAQQAMPTLFMAVMDDVEADEPGMLALADEYVAKGNFDAALLAVQLQAGVAPSPNVSLKMADIYLEQGIAPLAAALYQQVLQTDPGNKYARQQLAIASQETAAYPIPMPTIPMQAPNPQQAATPARKQTPLVEVPKGPRGGSGLLPYVMVTDLDASRSIDWPALRVRAGMNYASRWDDLTLVDACLWIPPDELRKQLGIEGRITARYTDYRCKFYVHATDANRAEMLEVAGAESIILLQIYIEFYDSDEPARANEATIGGSSQYQPFDAGARDLIVHTHNKNKHLYAYPRGGRTMWRLGYLAPGPELDLIYAPAGSVDNLGKRYLQLLVEKYGRQL